MVVGGGVDSLTEWKGDGFILISDFKKNMLLWDWDIFTFLSEEGS